MNVGIVGLGKLGLPVAYAMAARGVDVYGYDPVVSGPPESTDHERGLAETIEAAGGRMHFAPLDDVVRSSDVVFTAVQTPHAPRFEGITPLPDEREDFDYSYLVDAVKQIVSATVRQKRCLTLAVISTVLPGTMRRYIRPLLPSRISLAYNPSFIAMGTTIRDFQAPEFVLLGGDDEGRVAAVYEQLDIGPTRHMSIESAELTKVAYNTFIGLKVAFANTVMEVCEKTAGTDVDEVMGALKVAHRRLISPAYLDGGMGDGGACHPRDNIALSWLARELDLSFDLFEATMLQRERQARWLTDLMCEHDLPKGILGIAYKPGSAIVTGSSAALARELLMRDRHSVTTFDPRVHPGGKIPADPHVWLVGCNHPDWPVELPAGSVVIDPWRTWPDQQGVEVIRLGQHSPPHHGTAADGRAVRALAA